MESKEIERGRLEAIRKSDNLREASIEVIGDRYTIAQVVTLLSYIRNAIRTGNKTEINVMVGGKKSDTTSFNFTLNGEDVDDLIPVKNFEIN